MDYQIWCGPAMGAFNDSGAGELSGALPESGCRAIALNLLEGAAVITRAEQLRSYGAPVPASAFAFSPRPLA